MFIGQPHPIKGGFGAVANKATYVSISLLASWLTVSLLDSPSVSQSVCQMVGQSVRVSVRPSVRPSVSQSGS